MFFQISVSYIYIYIHVKAYISVYDYVHVTYMYICMYNIYISIYIYVCMYVMYPGSGIHSSEQRRRFGLRQHGTSAVRFILERPWWVRVGPLGCRPPNPKHRKRSTSTSRSHPYIHVPCTFTRPFKGIPVPSRGPYTSLDEASLPGRPPLAGPHPRERADLLQAWLWSLKVGPTAASRRQ